MSAPNLPAVTIARTFAAPRERVFRAFTDPTSIPEWFADEGATIEVVELDLRTAGVTDFVARTATGTGGSGASTEK